MKRLTVSTKEKSGFGAAQRNASVPGQKGASALDAQCRGSGRCVPLHGQLCDPHERRPGSFYRSEHLSARNIVEQSFQQFKNQTAGDRLYATSSTYMGKLFVQILAQSLRLMMRMACRRNETATNRLPNNSLTKAFMQLRYLKAINQLIATLGKQKRSRRKSEISLTCWVCPCPRDFPGRGTLEAVWDQYLKR